MRPVRSEGRAKTGGCCDSFSPPVFWNHPPPPDVGGSRCMRLLSLPGNRLRCGSCCCTISISPDSEFHASSASQQVAFHLTRSPTLTLIQTNLPMGGESHRRLIALKRYQRVLNLDAVALGHQNLDHLDILENHRYQAPLHLSRPRFQHCGQTIAAFRQHPRCWKGAGMAAEAGIRLSNRRYRLFPLSF